MQFINCIVICWKMFIQSTGSVLDAQAHEVIILWSEIVLWKRRSEVVLGGSVKKTSRRQSVYLCAFFTYLSIYSSTSTSIWTCIYISTYLSTYLTVGLSTCYLPTFSYIYSCMNLNDSKCISIYLSPSIRASANIITHLRRVC